MPRTHMLHIQAPARPVRRRQKKEESFVIGVPTRLTVRGGVLQACKYWMLMQSVACAVCGKSQSKEKSDGAPVVQAQRFSAK